jgi:protein phosphatase
VTTSTPTSATPRFIVGIHSDKSNYRMSNADAAGSHHDPGSGQTAFAVADGIGDWTWAETAALNAIRDALPVAVRRGALAGLLLPRSRSRRNGRQPVTIPSCRSRSATP